MTDLFGQPDPPAAPDLAKRKGKASAMHGESGHERIEHDLYETREPWITKFLIKRFPLTGPVWECACGKLAMARVLGERFEVLSSDIVDHGIDADLLAGVRWKGSITIPLDFLTQTEILKNKRGEPAQAIVTNPPYALADQFARKALTLTRPVGGKVALLLRNEWDSAAGRADLFKIMPFALKLVLTKRPRWFARGEGDQSPRHNFAWFCWDWRAEDLRRIDWGP